MHPQGWSSKQLLGHRQNPDSSGEISISTASCIAKGISGAFSLNTLPHWFFPWSRTKLSQPMAWGISWKRKAWRESSLLASRNQLPEIGLLKTQADRSWTKMTDISDMQPIRNPSPPFPHDLLKYCMFMKSMLYWRWITNQYTLWWPPCEDIPMKTYLCIIDDVRWFASDDMSYAGICTTFFSSSTGVLRGGCCHAGEKLSCFESDGS